MAAKDFDTELSGENGFLLNGKSLEFYWNKPRNRKPNTSWTLAIISTAIALTSIGLNLWQWSNPQTIFKTDLPDARQAIQYGQRKYTGALVYDQETRRAIRLKDGPVEYFGPPSDEIDAAWEELLKGEFIYMTEEEAKPYAPELRTIPPNNEYLFELDVFHSLHCLNALRQEVSKSVYPNMTNYQPHDHHLGNAIMPPGWDIAHMEHCMDRLRQVLMCHGDLTPSPLYRWDGFNIAFGRTGEHTCRKWEPVREWMDERKRKDELKDASRDSG